MLTYAQIIDGHVTNLAVFIEEPPQDFAGFDSHVLVPDDLPVIIGGTWDGEHFRDENGEIILTIVSTQEPENE